MIDTIIDNNLYFNYAKFSELCKDCCSEQTYNDTAFTILTAKQTFPDLDPKEAYHKYVDTKPECRKVVQTVVITNYDNGCGSCGGGKVR